MRTAAERLIWSHFLKLSPTLCFLPIFLKMKTQQEDAGPHALQGKCLFRVGSAPPWALLCSFTLKSLQTIEVMEGQKQTNGTASHEEQHSLLPGNPSSATDEVPGWHPTHNQGTARKRRETIPSVQSYILWNFLFSSKHVTLRTVLPPSSTPQHLNN